MTVDPTLETVRTEIDAIDNAIQDLIVRRTELVETVRRIKHGWPVKIQPSREAEIIYRLLARHHGPFPKRELVAIWRQLIIATLSFEGPFTIAVHVPDTDNGCWDVARDHFGMFTPITRHRTVRSVIEAVHRKEATVGVLPLPRSDDPDPWWRHLHTSQADAPKIIARLPFAGSTNARDGGIEALAICPVAVVPTGRDRSYLCGESDGLLAPVKFTAALKKAGIDTAISYSWQEPDRPQFGLVLAEVNGFVGADDPRLEEVGGTLGGELKRLLWLGAYACPLTTDDLGPAAFTAAASVRGPRTETPSTP